MTAKRLVVFDYSRGFKRIIGREATLSAKLTLSVFKLFRNEFEIFGAFSPAAKAREFTKKAHDNEVTTPERLQAEGAIPFVIKTPGRLGPAAISFIFSICGTFTLPRSRFLDTIVKLCNRYNGKMLRATRGRFTLYPQIRGQAIPVPA